MAHYRKHYINGQLAPSVTTVLSKFKDPGALMYWSWNVAYSVLAEAVSAMDGTGGSIAEFMKTNPLERGNFRNQSLQAAQAGTLAHDLVEQWIHATTQQKSELKSLSPREFATRLNVPLETAEQSLNAFSNFRKWATTSKFRPHHTELHLDCDEPPFHGTVDCIGKVNGDLCVIDWKTSKGLYADYLCQIAAYGILWNVNNQDKPIKGYHLLRFDKSSADFHHHYFRELEDAEQLFLYFCDCYELLKKVEARSK